MFLAKAFGAADQNKLTHGLRIDESVDQRAGKIHGDWHSCNRTIMAEHDLLHFLFLSRSFIARRLALRVLA